MILLVINTIWLTFVPVLGKTLIQTTSGPVRGTFLDSYGVQYYAYQGIPYAEKPTGELRFKAPIPKTPWTEELDASSPGRACVQTEGTYTKDEMSEDCLFVNVFVPANETEELLPVFFFIPGGQFSSNSGSANDMYGPQLLLRHNIVIVTFNYRLGALGFLSLNEEEASGNAGLKDILLVLKWVNDNVERFGGDPNRITIGGNSAGSAATQYLLLSKKSVGLFRQAILISGSALGYRFLARRPKENAIALGKELGITCSPQELLTKLKEVDVFDIVQAQENMGKNNTRNGFRPFAPFVPCIEIEHPDALITEDPRTILKAGIPNNVPMLVGFNSDEGLNMYPAINKNRKLLDYLNADFQRCIPSDIGYPHGSEDSKELARLIQSFYFDEDDISDANIQNFVDLVTDTMYTHSIEYAIQLHKDREDANKLYFYEFAFDGQLNYNKVKNKIDRPGTSHADEIGYLFVTDTTKKILDDVDNRTHRMQDIMTSLMTNFVKTGNPTPEGNNIGINWTECGKQRNYLYIDETLNNVDSRPIPSRLQFWQYVYDLYYRYMEEGGKIEYNIVP